jgi:cell division initiation protein
MPITPTEIRHVDLARAWLRGYPRRAVEELLEEIASSFETVWQERAGLSERVQELEADNAKRQELEMLLRSTLISAERAGQEVKEQARRESDLIVQEAHAEARRLTRELAAEKRRLEEDITAIRARLRAAFDVLGEWPRKESATESAEPVSATRPLAIDEALDLGVRAVTGPSAPTGTSS